VLWWQPKLPVGSGLNAAVEVVAAVAGEAGELPQEAKGQAGAQMQSIEAGQVRAAGHGPTQGPHRVGAELQQFGGGGLFQARRHHGDLAVDLAVDLAIDSYLAVDMYLAIDLAMESRIMNQERLEEELTKDVLFWSSALQPRDSYEPSARHAPWA